MVATTASGRLELEAQLEMKPGLSEDEEGDEVESVALETTEQFAT